MLRLVRDPILVDRLVAVLATVGVEAEVWLGGGTHGDPLPFALLGPLVTLPVAVRRRWPLQVALLATAVDAVATGFWGPPEVVSWFVAWAFALYGLAVWTGRREFTTGTLFFAVTSAVIVLGPGPTQGGVVFTLVALLVLMLVRRVVRDRELRADLLEREQGLRAREAVVEERARIARELHDMVAHNVSLIVVQAGAERRALPAEARSTRVVLTTIEEVGRQALVEMRRLLGMLRIDEEEESALAPQPNLATLELLVDQVRDAGLPVEVDIQGEPRPLAGGIELAAYRIIQEALTNSLRHAGGARAWVALRYGAESLEIEVSDDGRAAAESVGLGGGHGLVGMRERVALYGGTLDAGRRNGGGFTVRAVLPLR